MAAIFKTILGHGEQEPNPLTMSDDQISEQIYSTHVHSDAKIDVDSLFNVADNILRRSTHIVDNVVQGSQGSPDLVEDKPPQASFFSPLCTLKQISSEMSCKPPGEEIAHKTTLAILNKVSSFDWETKAVLALAAFALEYGEFWLLAQLQSQPIEPLAKSVAILKRVPVLTKPQALRKYRQAIVELNSLIKATLLVVELILKIDNLSHYDSTEVPALADAMKDQPVDVYWSIITIVAIVTQIDCLTTESEHRQELSHYGQKINIILSKLRKYWARIELEIEDVEYKKMMDKVFATPTEIMVVIKLLLFWKDVPQTPIYDGASQRLISIDTLKKKNVYLFVSTLDITEEEINVLKTVYEKTKTDNQYKIVWVPIVEEWTDQLKKKFEMLKAKMPWYVVQHFGRIRGYKYINVKWSFKAKPMVVVVNHQGKILHPNAYHLVQSCPDSGFPYTKSKEEELAAAARWLKSLVKGFNRGIGLSLTEGKYSFLYGGKDKEWIQQFTKYASALTTDAALKQANISVELFCVENENKNVVSQFWRGIESLFVTKMNNKTTNAVTLDVQKMLSYKNETGWVLLCKGETVMLTGHGSTMLRTVAEFDKWKEVAIKNDFVITFREYHQKVVSTIHRCSHLEIPNVAGKIPEVIKCPECNKTMEVFISYKCCHNETTPSNA